MNTRNLFACLVHERRECVIDLVRNLHHLDPDSSILLYNGGPDSSLLEGPFPLEKYNAVVHPAPRPMAWGTLHGFALDCMRFGLENIQFDTLTIVDSDQLCVGRDYSRYLGRFLEGVDGVGMLGSAPEVQPWNTRIAPAAHALRERELWRPFLRRFADGERKYVHWSFWPTTVFTVDACRDLLRIFEDAQLAEIMKQSQIWATEEVILPTLVSLLGYQVAANPCRQDFVKYRVAHCCREGEQALQQAEVFWIHPVPRRYDDPLRTLIRSRLSHYRRLPVNGGTMNDEKNEKTPSLLLTRPILELMRPLEGWLDDDEADLLIAAAGELHRRDPHPAPIVEVGSYCGRSTVVLGSVVKCMGSVTRLYAIDPHDGVIGAMDQGLEVGQPTFDRFQRNIASAGLTDVVRPIPEKATDVDWDQPIGLLFIDALHDYVNVSQDFHHFESWIVPGGLVAFHDYADYYPGVVTFVDELLAGGSFEKIGQAQSLIVVRKKAEVPSTAHRESVPAVAAPASNEASPADEPAGPMVSCIMPTADRSRFVPQAIRYFLRQDYSNRELIVVDDGRRPVEVLMPEDPRVRYVRHDVRHSMGWKHNFACEMARGEVVVHWDDDDWYADWRITYQVAMLQDNPDAELTGLSRLFFYAPHSSQAWVYQYPVGQRTWVCGSSFCYRKALWERQRFEDVSEGADTRFAWSMDERSVLALPDSNFLVAIAHPGNTSPKRTTDPRYAGHPLREIEKLLKGDWTFYHETATRAVPAETA